MNEGVETNGRDHNDEYADREHGHDHELLLHAHVQVCQMLQRKNHDSCVQKNVDGCSNPTLKVDIIATTLVQSVPLRPSKADRQTLEGGGEEECDGIRDRESHDRESKCPKPFGGKYAEVEEENRDLGDAKSHDIENLA